MEAGAWYWLLDAGTGRRKHVYAAHVPSPGLADAAEKCSRRLHRKSSIDIPSINSSLQPAFSVAVRLRSDPIRGYWQCPIKVGAIDAAALGPFRK